MVRMDWNYKCIIDERHFYWKGMAQANNTCWKKGQVTHTFKGSLDAQHIYRVTRSSLCNDFFISFNEDI